MSTPLFIYGFSLVSCLFFFFLFFFFFYFYYFY